MIKLVDTKPVSILNIQDILLAQDVNRWTIINVTRPQSLAEHTFNVVAISRSIAAKIGVADNNIIKYALDHDLDEILTGDIPTPAKEMLKVRDSYAGKSKMRCNSLEVAIVSVADIIEAIWYANVHGLGRRAANMVDDITERLNQRIALYQSLHDKFTKAVGETIDEIEHGEFIAK